MYIRMVTKQNRNPEKRYTEYRLVRSYRQGSKVGQIVVMTMPDIRVPKEQWRHLAAAIEAMLNGQELIFHDQVFEKEAERWVQAYLSKKSRSAPPYEANAQTDDDYEYVRLSSHRNRNSRTVGGEHLALSFYRELGFEQIFKELEFTTKQRNEAALSIIGRMLNPGSEHAAVYWARNMTGLGVLLDTDFSRLSHNALYRITDQIYKHKEYIEEELRNNERSIFNLEESILLYDLTNTYLEGMAAGIPKARFGHSKEKRYDCRLLTLGLVLDNLGFPKRSLVMEGSVSEPGTLERMVGYLSEGTDRKPITVVIDAGIASEDNLAWLRSKGMHYICVARNKPVPLDLIDPQAFVPIPNRGENLITAQVFRQDDECVLYCKSEKMEKKEKAMCEKFCSKFEAELDKINLSLAAGRGKRKFEYVQERVARLKERIKSVSGFYTINIDQAEGKARQINYHCDRMQDLENKYSGSYFLRTSHLDLSSDSIWSMYMMLNTVESAFRTLKSELNFRPVYHQIEPRAEAHLFIAVLAYHVVNAILHRLRENGIRTSWETLRKMMESHTAMLSTMQTRAGYTICIVDNTEAEDNHKTIYDALNLPYNPVRRKTTKQQLV